MIEIVEGHLGRCIRATRAIAPGELITSGWGRRVPERTRHSLEVDAGVFIDFVGAIPYLNHSCDPNCGVLMLPERRRAEVHAMRRIEPGEDLCSDYASFEAEILHMPDLCLCGAAICRGRITGYDGLPPERRAALGRYVAPHLRGRELLVSRAV